MRCRHCLYSAGEKEIEEMNYENIKKLIEEFAEISKKEGTLNIFGGEVFLRSDIFKIIELAISKNLKVGITTNANLSQRTIDWIARAKINRLTVDIDGADAETHDWLRNKKGHFNKSLAAIKTFLENGKFTTANIVLHKKNALQIDAILNLCRKIGIDFISFYFFTPLGRGKGLKNLMISPKQWKKLRDQVKRWIEINQPKFGIIWERSYEYTTRIDTISLCLCRGEPSDVIDIRCDGNVYYCGLLLAVDFGCLGNVRRESLKKVLARRKKCAIGIDFGCAALAYNNNPEKLIDPRLSTEKIVPVCPYDWEVLCGFSPDLKGKFAHIHLKP